MKPIKVIHISYIEVDNYYLNNLVDFTDKNEVDFSAVTFAPHAGFVEGMEKRGIRAYSLDSMSRKKYPQAIKKLWEILKQENPEIVHLHLFEPTIIGLILARLQNRKTVLTRHHSDALHQLSRSKKKVYLQVENYVNRKCDKIIAPSQMVRDILVEWEKTPAEKVSIIPYGQTTERFDKVTEEVKNKVRNELIVKEDELTLVCNSRLYHRKGHIYLFEALAPLLKKGLKAKLFLIGKGEYQTHLENIAEELGIKESVKFLGWRDDALAVMAIADIIVHPSLEDALSSAVIESLMLERPIIATDISGVRDSLDNGKYGRIVPPMDSNAFRQALEEMSKNLDEARKRAKQGRKYITEYMDAGRVAREYTKIYKDLVNWD